MRVGDFGMEIIGGVESNDYVYLANGTQYKVRLSSYSKRHCDVTLLIDGKRIEAFRLNSGESITLERPPNDNGCFTFYRADGVQAKQAGVSAVAPFHRGLITAVFRVGDLPTVKMLADAPVHDAAPRSARNFVHGASGQHANCSAGITGLSGSSQQKFIDVADLRYDPAVPVTQINIRLVCQDEQVRELQPSTVANLVPPPVS